MADELPTAEELDEIILRILEAESVEVAAFNSAM
jgi:hypothetical protein